MTSRLVEGSLVRREALRQICMRHGVVGLYAFGSRQEEAWRWLEGTQAEMASGPSDVDIGALAGRGVDWSVRDKVVLALELEDLFAVSRVDLVSLSEADPFLAAEVIRGARLYALDDYLAAEYELYVLRRAGDLAPLERERLRLLMEERP